MIAPLIYEEKVLGLITLISSKTGVFSESELYLLIGFASMATAAIQNAQLHSAVQHMAITDPLTEVYNRRGFFQLARQKVDSARQTGEPAAAIMIDIDFFKRINDAYGHDAGDFVLHELASRCRKVLQETDLVCRYGGEEFAILLPETGLARAREAANQVFQSITGTGMQTPSGEVMVTISVGIAVINETCDTLEQLLKRADQALYLAKAEGRNRVRVWGE
jgi:diguanylate cyclase (GGDEF)-like protein